MKKIGLLSNVFISLFIVILASGSVSSGVSANENKEISYNVLVSENKSIEDVEDVLQSQGIKVTDKIPEINFLTISTEKSEDTIKKENSNYIDDIVIDNTMTVKPNITYLYGDKVYTNTNLDFWGNQWDMQKSISTGSKFQH
ncbi:TPA: peptidase S8, partial [Streptococcus suis]